jgi:hypothetical protein
VGPGPGLGGFGIVKKSIASAEIRISELTASNNNNNNNNNIISETENVSVNQVRTLSLRKFLSKRRKLLQFRVSLRVLSVNTDRILCPDL